MVVSLYNCMHSSWPGFRGDFHLSSGFAHTRTTRILALFCVLLSGGLIVAGFAVWQTDRDMRDDLLWKARTAAQAIKLDHVRALSGTRSDLENPGYVRLQRQISSVLSANPEYVYAYLMGRADDGTVFFFLDTQQYDGEDDPPSQPGDACADASAELRGVFDTAAPERFLSRLRHLSVNAMFLIRHPSSPKPSRSWRSDKHSS